jgi:SnoaL-like domain
MVAATRISRRGLAALALAGGTAVAAAPATTRAGKPLPIADRLELTELIARYAWAYDCGEAELMADTFTADGSIEAWGKQVGSGRTGLIEFARGLFAERGDRDWQHLTDHHVFEGGGESCTVYSYYSMLEGTRTDPREFRVRSFGYYVSECVRQDGGWRFRKRSIHRWNAQRAPWRSAGGSTSAVGNGRG